MRKLNTKGSDIFVDILIVKPRIKNIGTQATEVHTKGKDTELHLTVVLFEKIEEFCKSTRLFFNARILIS